MGSSHLDGRQQRALAQMVPFIILATLAVFCRFFARRLARAQIGADDYTIVVGLAFAYGSFICAVCGKSKKNFQHCNIISILLKPSLQRCMRAVGDIPVQFQKLTPLYCGRSGPFIR